MNKLKNKGKILLVGFGPGAAEHMTIRAREAIREADVVIGYATYIRLVEDLLDGKEVIGKGMTEEIGRCVAACEQAQQGKTVALISSGDIGIYGMAGLTYELLLQRGWQPEEGIQVEVIPGATALSTCASLVGAPLTHDFCTISLSDLLTPWPQIARRLEAAARGDFVIALYNPKSGRRTAQIEQARRILLRYRSPDTPVAVVRSAYRKQQHIEKVRLEQMADCEIGMLSTVLIGNSSTYRQAGLMITPRGYNNKYTGLTGAIRLGEKRGRSLSLGLDGWKACVREYLREQGAVTLQQAAKTFDAPLGEIIAAIGEAASDDRAGRYEAAAVEPERLVELLQAMQAWGQLRASVGCNEGVVGEFLLHADDFALHNDWLQVENSHLRLRVDYTKIEHIWLVRDSSTLRAVSLLDPQGELLLELALPCSNEGLASSIEAAFGSAWQQLSKERSGKEN